MEVSDKITITQLEHRPNEELHGVCSTAEKNWLIYLSSIYLNLVAPTWIILTLPVVPPQEVLALQKREAMIGDPARELKIGTPSHLIVERQHPLFMSIVSAMVPPADQAVYREFDQTLSQVTDTSVDEYHLPTSGYTQIRATRNEVLEQAMKKAQVTTYQELYKVVIDNLLGQIPQG